MSLDIVLHPLLPWPLIAVIAAATLMLTAILAIQRARGWPFRVLALMALMAATLNPGVLNESREARPDLVIVVVDDSPSQRIGDRPRQSAEALADLQQKLARFDNIDVRVVRSDGGGGQDGTHLFDSVSATLAAETGDRLAGIVMITDGQVEDAPNDDAALPGPLHVILTGAPEEADRRLVIDEAPAYTLVGSTVRVLFRVDDGRPQRRTDTPKIARVRVRVDGQEAESLAVEAGRPQAYDLVLRHAGATIIEFEAEAVAGELSSANNRAVVTVQGVRDRLNVLLISGQPHPGERLWRNMLKSDPAVDLVHFTILRPPDTEEFASVDELSLIAFPVQELFEEKLYDFDLVIFDRYLMRGVLPFRYLTTVSDYVRDGGALLLAVGPEFAGPDSLYRTPLGEAMPAAPTGRIVEQAYRPTVSALGRRHPVTSALPGEMPMGDALQGGENGFDEPGWGQWFRLIEAEARSGAVLMTGAGGRPLLAVERIGAGRIAQLLSDQLWLWARGYDGGGPDAELVRRLVHWLMQEPELEEEQLNASVDDGQLLVERRSLDLQAAEIIVTAPSGAEQRMMVEPGDDGIGRAEVPALETGLYRIDDGKATALAASGRIDSREDADLRATEGRLRPVVEASEGGLFWAIDGKPDVRRVQPGRAAAGLDWLGLRRKDQSVVTAVSEVPLLPALLSLAFALAALAGAWWREGR
ncbi:MAG: hypothetical protein IPM60_00625 [Rhodospirillales bacterium]|nr:hypothetical protein [Rhodospirillales bacterium]